MTPKPKPFHKLWNKTFLKRVLKSYTAQPQQLYLCHTSPEFAFLWSEHRQLIRELALNFHHPCIRAIGYNSLFHTTSNRELPYPDCNKQPFRQVRIDFLKHEIKRLTKPKTTSVQ